MQMFLGIILIINQVSVEWALVAKLLVGSDSDTPISFRSLLSVRFLVKVKFPSCVLHLWLDSQDALRDWKQMKYDATKVYSPTLTFLDASL